MLLAQQSELAFIYTSTCACFACASSCVLVELAHYDRSVQIVTSACAFYRTFASASGSSAVDRSQPEPCGCSNSEETTNYKTIQAC